MLDAFNQTYRPLLSNLTDASLLELTYTAGPSSEGRLVGPRGFNAWVVRIP